MAFAEIGRHGSYPTIFWRSTPESAMNDLMRDRILPAIAEKTLEIKEIEKENVCSNE